MATNTQRDSANLKGTPTITIVDSVEPNRNDRMRSCCMCVPELVGVFSILSMYFFLGILGAAASFVNLGSADNAIDIGFSSVSGTLNTFVAIASALGITAIRKEKPVLMRRLSIAFWILTVLMLLLNLIFFILDIKSKDEYVEDCESNSSIASIAGSEQSELIAAYCKRAVNTSLIIGGFKFAIIEIISMYFAYVIFRFAKRMKKEVLPFTAEPVDGQKTPTYFVYSTQPPTSTNWVPPPTYSVRPTFPIPDDYNPDSKNTPN
uniref:Uncharacterized protein n=1 Tax=Anthurium amnicola TaxID=1678845 RepID=A0A1D1ZE17_9ARAE